MLRVISLSLLCLTFLATSAAAECAWVLWIKVDDPTGKPLWTLAEGFPSNKFFGSDKSFEIDIGYKACVRERDETETKMMSEEARRERTKYGFKNPYAVCLPDTVDPRGPKGR